ncbi:unnamed protein product [Ilex paraguariensis]|uniref:Peptidase A1 domain-containing protein n=1 Tax=Ilex paraguariensis TaxID=185542 RepID=A0ABC8U1D6_9AQUA
MYFHFTVSTKLIYLLFSGSVFVLMAEIDTPKLTGVVTSGELAEDTIAVELADWHRIGYPSVATIHHFLFSCAPTQLLRGLASGVKGILGLAKTRIALPSQLANTFDFQKKFAICLSSSDGAIFAGGGPYVSLSGTDISRTLVYTPFVSNQDHRLEEYFINVKSIRIKGKRLSFNSSLLSVDQQGRGGTKISTTVPYTTFESTIYETFTRAYIMAASSMNMTRVAPVAPFGVCFNSKTIDNTLVGAAVPVIDLVLQSEMVRWKIYGRNSMVMVSDEVMCLGFLDGGLSPKTSIVIGGYQLEDNLLEFDLRTSMLGFSSSLLMRQTSCSDFKLTSSRFSESI